MPSDVIYDLGGIKVVWSQQYAVYEVLQRVGYELRGDVWDWVADTPNKEEAVLIADDLFCQNPLVVPQDYYDSAIDF